MLWWLIGAWVASGPLIPVLWLLSMACRNVLVRPSNDKQAARAPTPPSNSKRAIPNRGHMGRFLLSGLAWVGAVILLFISSLNDPITTMGSLYSDFAHAPAPVLQPTVTPSPIEVELAAVKPADREEEGTVGHDLARKAVLAAPQIPPVWALRAALSAVTPPAYPERPSKRGWQHGRRGPISAYVAQSHRGTWLFPPNPNAGGNN